MDFRKIRITLCTTMKEKTLPVKLWHTINVKIHLDFRAIKMWKICILESMRYDISFNPPTTHKLSINIAG